jgi:hypothetical protein
MWVRSEYASELAVLSAWLAALVPWNVAYHARAPLDSTVFFVRFALVELQLRAASEIVVDGEALDVDAALATQYPGTELVGDFFLTTPPTSALFYGSSGLGTAGWIWSLASLCFLAALALSLALYVREDAVRARLPVSEVRLMGVLLAVGALGTAAATVLYYTRREIVGVPIPVGVVVVGILAAVLLRTERV